VAAQRGHLVRGGLYQGGRPAADVAVPGRGRVLSQHAAPAVGAAQPAGADAAQIPVRAHARLLLCEDDGFQRNDGEQDIAHVQRIHPEQTCLCTAVFDLCHGKAEKSHGTALHVQELRRLHLDCTIAEGEGKTIGSNFEFLPTFPELRELTFECLDCVSDSLTEAVLAMPKLEQLRFIQLQDRRSSDAVQLIAKATAQRPGLRVAFEGDQPEAAAPAASR
jgi:hypothetical protein